MAQPRSPRLTPKLRDLVATDRLGRPPVGRLTDAQADALAKVALEQHEFDEPVSAPRALAALATGRPDAAMPVLARVLPDAKAPRSNRVAAAAAAGTIATPDAEALLLAAARDRDPRVQQAVFAALGWFAGPRVALELGKVQAGDVHARRQLELARALVAHRHGLDGPFLPPAPAGRSRLTQRSATAPLSLSAKTPKATATDLTKVRGPMFGIAVAPRAYALRCGRREWTVFVHEELGSLRAQSRLVERPWIAAVLGSWYSDRLLAITQYVVLTRPDDGAAHIDVVRGDGEIVYTGTATPTGTATTFSIVNVERAATAPLRLEGRLTGRGVELEVALAGPRRVDTRTTAEATAG
jgi:hypothetical protein